MKKIFSLLLFLTSLTFGQSELLLLFEGADSVKVPTSLLAVGNVAKITLSWTNAETYDSIKIYRGLSANPTALAYTLAGSLTSKIDTPLTAGTIYYYRIKGKVGESLSSYSPNANDTVKYDADAKTYFDAIMTPLSDMQKARVNTFIMMLKDSLAITTLSSKFDVMYLLANETSEAGLKNLVKRNYDATAVNAPAFTQWEGFKGNGISSYLNTNYTPNIDSAAYTLYSASFGVYFRTTTDGTNYEIHGTLSTTAYGGLSHRCILGRPNQFHNNYGIGINSDAVSQASTDSLGGFMVATRTGYNLQKGYFNKVVKVTGTTVATKKPDQKILILAQGTIISTSTFYDNDQVSFAFLGAGFDATDVRKLTNSVEWYMDDLGKGVIP